MESAFESPGGPPALEIVFVHGLEGDCRGTWRSVGLLEGDLGWPRWLGEEINRSGVACRVWLAGYPAASTGWRGWALPMLDPAGNLLELLDLDLAPRSRLFFIGHSLGGLMIKRLLGLARDKSGSKSRLPDRTAGILFLGTPHQGAGLAGAVNALIPRLLSRATVTVDELERDNPELRSLYHSFVAQARLHGWLVHQFIEGRNTGGVRVVDEHSGFSGVGDWVTTDDDHVSLAKPASRHGLVFKRALRMAMDMQPPAQAPAQDELRRLLRQAVHGMNLQPAPG